jgi:dethiobiotin synthetase
MNAMNNDCEKIFVTGTGTDVGKTILSLTLMKRFFEQGFSPFYLKPIQTGCLSPCDEYSDARFIYETLPELKAPDAGDSVLYCLKEPIAPFFAAEAAGVTIDIRRIKNRIAEKAEKHSHIVIEGAGGLLVPVKKSYTVMDLIRDTGARTVVAASAGLGTINHTLMTIEILRSNNIHNFDIYFIENNPSISKNMIQENIKAVELFSGVKIKETIGFNPSFSG